MRLRDRKTEIKRQLAGHQLTITHNGHNWCQMSLIAPVFNDPHYSN